MRTPEETKAYLKHRTFAEVDLAVLRYLAESQPQLCFDAFMFRRPSGDVSPSRPNCDVDTFMRWYYREIAVINWEQRTYECVKDLVANRVENGKPVSVERACALAKRIREELSIK